MAFSEEQVASVGRLLNDTKRPLKERFRALFTLKNIGGATAIGWIAKAFQDDSDLLKHELAYCLGQMQDTAAVPALTAVLVDLSEAAIVRHEAAEALGAIGAEESLAMLEKFCEDDKREVAETCRLAVSRLRWKKGREEELHLDDNMYRSVDPAPASKETETAKLRQILLDEDLDMFERYRAMFSLRNKGDEDSVRALGEGFSSGSALFRHEVAFVLGQMASPIARDVLKTRLDDPEESAMVRHECAEALGSISGDDVRDHLEKYVSDNHPAVVRESCVIALDMADYGDSKEFQYCNALDNVEST